jgi:SAM-dependent methyltransferase
LDVQTGGGERFAEALSKCEKVPESLAATESWPPNVEVARQTLVPFGVLVSEVSERDRLPFEDDAFDLVCSRHPTVNNWPEIFRVLRLDGVYFSQQIGAGTNSELTDFFMGPQLISNDQRMDVAVAQARSVGLEVLDAREESMPVVFFDIGAVVYFLRKVIWTVPDFSVDRYRERLRLLHGLIEKDGSFTSHSKRFIIEARK